MMVAFCRAHEAVGRVVVRSLLQPGAAGEGGTLNALQLKRPVAHAAAEPARKRPLTARSRLTEGPRAPRSTPV